MGYKAFPYINFISSQNSSLLLLHSICDTTDQLTTEKGHSEDPPTTPPGDRQSSLAIMFQSLQEQIMGVSPGDEDHTKSTGSEPWCTREARVSYKIYLVTQM